MSAVLEKPRSRQRRTNRRRWGHTILAALATAFIIALVAFVSWATTPLAPTQAALGALESDAAVTVSVSDDMITLTPTSKTADTGLVFYPGGDVDYRAYAAPARALAEQGFLVVIPRVLFNHAVFSPGVAEGVIAAFPEVESWAVGGHSLGGAMAAQFAVNQPDLVDGVAFWGAYPGTDSDWSDVPLDFAVIFGSRDGLVSADEIAAARAQLPDSTAFVAIDGGNHAQFGDYGAQEGDNVATISAAEQQQIAVEATAEWLRGLTDSAE